MGDNKKKVILSFIIFAFICAACAFAETTEELFKRAGSLSAMDRLEEAYDTYQMIIDLDPSNIKARVEQAKMVVWQGRNRDGISMLEEILVKHPDNIDALRELAYAYHWDGMDEDALMAIKRIYAIEPGDQGAKSLEGMIMSSNRGHIGQYNSHSFETLNDTNIFTSGIRAGFAPDLMTRVEMLYEHEYLNNGISAVGASRYGAGGSFRISRLIEINSHLYATNFDNYGFYPLTTNTWITLKPSDAVRCDISYDRETFQDIGSITNNVIVDNYSASFDFKPDRFWLVSGRLRQGNYSDSNGQSSFLGRVEYRVNQKPYIKAYYHYYSSGWKKQLASGYFNPFSVVSHVAGISSDIEISSSLSLNGSLGIGEEFQDMAPGHHVLSASLGLYYTLNSDWTASLKGYYQNSSPDTINADYKRNIISLDLTYHMEGAKDLLHGASHFSRPDN